MRARGVEHAEQPAITRVLVCLAAIFALTHATFYAFGGRFDRTTLLEFLHFMDPELLKHRLLETCFFMHIQPPLMNFFVGLGLKLPEPLGALVFHAAFLVFGLTLYLSLFVLQVRLGVSRGIAAVLSTLFMLSPSFIVYEHWLFYTLPCAMLLVVATLFMFDSLETRRSRAIAGFFVTLLALCGLRSMFHLYYFVLVLAITAYLCKGYRKRVLAIAAIPLLLLFGLYFKNYVLFGKFSTCTFVGKNLWITTVGNMGWPDRERLIEEGEISELSRVNRWSSLSAYPPGCREVAGFEDIPVLRQTHKSTGAVNYNHLAQIAICDQYGKDALYVLKHYPRFFFNATVLSWFRYFKSSTALPVSTHNRETLGFLIAVYDYLFYGKLPLDLAPYARFFELADTPPHLLLLFGLPLVFAYGLYAALKRASGQNVLTRTQRLIMLFMCFNIFFVALLGCTFDVLETSRYRFMTDALSVALLGVLIQHVSRSKFARRLLGQSGNRHFRSSRHAADYP